MTKLIMMRGLPASGKTTEAKKMMAEFGNFFRVNKDELRAMMFVGKFNYKKEKQVVRAERLIVGSLLETGVNVIVDDTNLREKDLEYWQYTANEYGAKFEVKKMETGVFECLDRDKVREKKVGENVIWSMALKYKLWKPSTLGVVLCDIDGTLADIKHRLHFVSDKEKPDWKSFFSEIKHDEFRQEVWDEVEDLIVQKGYDLFLVSGRNNEYRAETEKWLEEHSDVLDFSQGLIMRNENDYRPDTDIKEDILKLFGAENIVKVFDDRPRVIKMWRKNKVEVVDVGDGIDF